ncbi:MAG: hypothetical protein UY50_C0010G0017 [Parcubacteria group bacterium GW2011_GWA2_49_9]|nr:MAG: hypothetical protein UY50_C0010G0017 [Parcubacteria group bacterium GW2011_GWA2_49_9]
MKRPRLTFVNTAVFVIFFGIALIEVYPNLASKGAGSLGNWLEAGLFLTLGVLSLWADVRKK